VIAGNKGKRLAQGNAFEQGSGRQANWADTHFSSVRKASYIFKVDRDLGFS
jgi:hypothetical protein